MPVSRLRRAISVDAVRDRRFTPSPVRVVKQVILSSVERVFHEACGYPAYLVSAVGADGRVQRISKHSEVLIAAASLAPGCSLASARQCAHLETISTQLLSSSKLGSEALCRPAFVAAFLFSTVCFNIVSASRGDDPASRSRSTLRSHNLSSDDVGPPSLVIVHSKHSLGNEKQPRHRQ